MPYVDTYYKTRLDRPEAYPRLTGAHGAEVCVIGGGLAGLTTALELARAGTPVCLLEGERVGWGASGRNGGMVSPGYSARGKTIELYAGKDQARALHALSVEGVEIVSRNIADLKIENADVVPGHLSAARYASADDLLHERDRLQAEFGYEVEFWDRDRVRSVLLTDRYHQGLYSPSAFHFNPLNYARALAAEIVRLGGTIFENSAVLSLTAKGAARQVVTEGGVVTARHVVITTGGYTGRLASRVRSSFLPVATYVMLTQPDPDLIASAIRTPAGVGDRRRAGDYYRLVDGGKRILWGGKITTRTSEPRRLGALLHDSMSATFPQLKALPVDIAWSGLMSYARHLMPQIGRLEDGLWYCTAFGGHGVNTTAIGGKVMAEMILGQSDRVRLFEPFGLVWNGGAFGRMAVQSTYWALQAQDALREAQSH